MSVGSPAAVGAFKLAETKTRQLLRADCAEISGSGRQVADRHACDQGERGGISAWTERLWSGCGLPAVTGHILPMAHSWTSMSGCQVSQRGPAGTLRCWYHLQDVYVSKESLHCHKLHLSPRKPLRQVTDGNTNNNWQLCTHETVLFTRNQTINAYTAYKTKCHEEMLIIYMVLCTNMIHVSK